MDSISIKCTIYFEDPFWVGIFEKNINKKLKVCRVVFGPEPKDYEVYEYILKYYYNLKFSPEINIIKNVKIKVNPKRLQRDSKNQTLENGIGTKSQQALKLQQEKNKVLRKIKSKEEKEFEKERMYSLKQKQRKEKHKGR